MLNFKLKPPHRDQPEDHSDILDTRGLEMVMIRLLSEAKFASFIQLVYPCVQL